MKQRGSDYEASEDTGGGSWYTSTTSGSDAAKETYSVRSCRFGAGRAVRRGVRGVRWRTSLCAIQSTSKAAITRTDGVDACVASNASIAATTSLLAVLAISFECLTKLRGTL